MDLELFSLQKSGKLNNKITLNEKGIASKFKTTSAIQTDFARIQVTNGLPCIDFSNFIEIMDSADISVLLKLITMDDEFLKLGTEKMLELARSLPAFNNLVDSMMSMKRVTQVPKQPFTPSYTSLSTVTKFSEKKMPVTMIGNNQPTKLSWAFPSGKFNSYVNKTNCIENDAKHFAIFNIDPLSINWINELQKSTIGLFFLMLPELPLDNTITKILPSLISNIDSQLLVVSPNLNNYKARGDLFVDDMGKQFIMSGSRKLFTDTEDYRFYPTSVQKVGDLLIKYNVSKNHIKNFSEISADDWLSIKELPLTNKLNNKETNEVFLIERFQPKIKAMLRNEYDMKLQFKEKFYATPKYDGFLRIVIIYKGYTVIILPTTYDFDKDTKTNIKYRVFKIFRNDSKCIFTTAIEYEEVIDSSNGQHLNVPLRLLRVKGLSFSFNLLDLNKIRMSGDFSFLSITDSIKKVFNNVLPTDGVIYHMQHNGLYMQKYIKATPTHDLDNILARRIDRNIKEFKGIREFDYNPGNGELILKGERPDKSVSDSLYNFINKVDLAVDYKFKNCKLQTTRLNKIIYESKFNNMLPTFHGVLFINETPNNAMTIDDREALARTSLTDAKNEMKLWLIGETVKKKVSFDYWDSGIAVSHKITYEFGEKTRIVGSKGRNLGINDSDKTNPDEVDMDTEAIQGSSHFYHSENACILSPMAFDHCFINTKYLTDNSRMLFVAEPLTINNFWMMSIEFMQNNLLPNSDITIFKLFCRMEKADMCCGTGALTVPVSTFPWTLFDLENPESDANINKADCATFEAYHKYFTVMNGPWSTHSEIAAIAKIYIGIIITTTKMSSLKSCQLICTMDWVCIGMRPLPVFVYFKFDKNFYKIKHASKVHCLLSISGISDYKQSSALDSLDPDEKEPTESTSDNKEKKKKKKVHFEKPDTFVRFRHKAGNNN